MEIEIKNLQTVLQEDPSNFQARRELSFLLVQNGFNEEALSNLLYLAKYFPEDAELQYNLGILYEKLKDFESAELAYKKAIEISPQEDFYYNLGEVLVSLQKWDEAIETFKTVIKTDANDGNCYFNIGLCYYHKEEHNPAIDAFQKAIELNPKDIFAHFYMGNIYQNNGLTNFAEESYKKVLEISPDYSWAYFNLASIAYENKDFETAIEYLLKTVDSNKDDIEAYKLLTKIGIQQNDTEEIITLLESRLEKDENGDLFYILACVYKHIGKKDEYIFNLKKAIKNTFTLTFPIDIVKKEFSSLNLEEDLEVNEVEEYSNNFDENDSSEFEEFYDEEDSSEDSEFDNYDEIEDSE